MRLIILYGSQTGTAQDVAEQIWRESKQYDFTGPVLAIDDFPVDQLIEERLAIFVVATTGNGDEPDNMRQTWKFLLRRSLPPDSLRNLQFACLGLGDSSYAKFNYAAKKLNKRLLQLGASELQTLGLCDDQHDHGLSAVSLPWIKIFFEKMRTLLRLSSPLHNNVIRPIFKWRLEIMEQIKLPIDGGPPNLRWPFKQTPLELKLLKNQRTTTDDHFQDVRFLQFGYPEGTTWNAGDILEIRPCNSNSDINAFFELVTKHNLDFDAETVVQLQSCYEDIPVPLAYSKMVSVGQLVKYVWDLKHRPRQRVFELLALNCKDELEREKLFEFTTVDGLEDLIAYINRPRRTLLEVLQDFPKATSKLTLPILCEMFPIIQTRCFSIASMAEAELCTLDLIVAIVEYKTKLSTPRLGLCSQYLRALKVNSIILGNIKPGTMTIPENIFTPLIMIGPGTGIAPFRSVIQYRKLQQRKLKNENTTSIGEIIVFFGCRSKTKDFHFESDFGKWEHCNLIKAYYAFSRDQPHKIYVQHLLRENSKIIATLIRDKDATILVAGSSSNMPKAVREAIIVALDGDKDYFDKLIKLKRYQEETWS